MATTDLLGFTTLTTHPSYGRAGVNGTLII